MPEAEVLPVFTPPKPHVGEKVLWYANADRYSAPHVGTVVRVGQYCIEMYTVSASGDGQVRVSIRHIKDPFLNENEAWKKRGGWDFTQEYYDNIAFQEEIRERIKRLEANIGIVDKRDMDEHKSEINRLRGELQLAGVEVNFKWNKSTLEKKLAELKQPA